MYLNQESPEDLGLGSDCKFIEVRCFKEGWTLQNHRRQLYHCLCLRGTLKGSTSTKLSSLGTWKFAITLQQSVVHQSTLIQEHLSKNVTVSTTSVLLMKSLIFTVCSYKRNLSWSAVEEAKTAAWCGSKKPAGLHIVAIAAMCDSGRQLDWTRCALELHNDR